MSLSSISVLTESPPPSRVVSVIGINSNVVVNGVEFHVQTEDLGPRYGHLITQVFGDGGRVIKSVRLDYSQHLDKPNLQAVLPRVMKAHHAKVIRGLQLGHLDSIPPCVTMRRSTPEENVHLADIARSAGIKDLPDELHSITPSTARSRGADPGETQAPESAPLSLANIWDRLVEDAHHEVTLTSATRNGTDPVPASSAWDRAVESSRVGTREIRSTRQVSTPDAAALAYAQGLVQMRGPDKTLAVISLAHAVELDPTNRLYRAALRKVLDWLDEHE